MVTEASNGSYTGVYSVKEASLYVKSTMERTPIFPRLTTHHLHWWLREGLGDDHDNSRSGEVFINFLELVSFRLTSSIRAHGVPSSAIRIAHNQLKSRYNWTYPFAMEQLWVAQPDIFANIQGTHVAISRYWQAALDFMAEYLIPVHGLSFDAEDQASSWQASPGVLLDPKIQFGEPCLDGTRVPTETLWAFYQAGDSVETIGEMYYLPTSKVREAINWEERIARSTSE